MPSSSASVSVVPVSSHPVLTEKLREQHTCDRLYIFQSSGSIHRWAATSSGESLRKRGLLVADDEGFAAVAHAVGFDVAYGVLDGAEDRSIRRS
jgi:hypothetical protein